MNNQSNQGNQSSFYGLGIAPKIIEILDRMKFKVPTPIQAKAIPIAIDAKDIVGIAQTGTGKTLAFGIPMIQRLVSLQARGLILVPTRELAIQVEETIYKLGKLLSMRTAVLIGGASIYNQIQELRRNPRIIIATPGRLIDHLRQGNLRLDDVAILVLDEADLMLDMGFAPQIDKILQHLPHERQTMLFSATIPERIVKIAASYMKLPVSIEIAKSGTPAEKVRQEVFIIKKEEKPKLLAKILDQYRGAVLVFTRTKIGATRVTIGLRSLGYNTTTIHSRRSLTQRRE
ncbi:MAG: DEAD/DEAH box helicase domain protein, partial [Parcubacteria group bacterium GW2011_GWF2_50_9]